jgi:phosphodiesterase/alkaline phosphatase D-like protein
MRRFVIVPALAAASALIPSIATAAPSFTYGVTSSEVRPTSALLWARAPARGVVTAVVAQDREFRRKRVTKVVRAKTADDLTVQARVTRLEPGRHYFYFFFQGGKRSIVGTFDTAPKPTANKTIRFAVSGDDSGERDAQGKLLFNNIGAADMATFKQMAAERNEFNVNLGDTMYSDRNQNGPDLAATLAQKRSRYQEALSLGNYQRIRSTGSVYNQWDDHEFVDDYTPRSEACDVGSAFSRQYACDIPAIRTAGIKAFREYMPVTYSARNGTYRSFRWGKNLEIFILDERSFRSIRASEVKVDPSQPEPTNHVCETPSGTFDQDDPAPQVPQRLRDIFSVVYQPVATPVAPACLTALNDPARTMLGSRQYAAFTSAIKRSKATWKLIINEVPMMAQYVNTYDSWQGYEAEREKLLTFLKHNVKNVAFLTTDFHTNWVNDARIHTFPEDGGPMNSGIMDFIAGGVSDDLFGKEVDAFTHQTDSWKVLDPGFFLRQPPNGPGMQCSNMIKFGYLEVTAAAKKLTVTMKDNAGKQITMPSSNNKPCGPYVLGAK